MSSTTSDHLLAALLPAWKRRLQAWCLDGSLSAAAQQALVLLEIPAALQELVNQWSQGEFSTLPTIVPLPAAAMNGAAGAYAISRRTIVLNADWLLEASPKQVLTVLSEELGHHLDALLNASDTPGDEGELFAALLHGEGAISAQQRNRWLAENDLGSVEMDGDVVAVERASVVSTPIPLRWPGRSSGEFGNKFAFAALKADGSVVTWGAPSYGGDSRGVADQLNSGVSQIFSNGTSFAALKSDGSVVTWGGAAVDQNRVISQLRSGVTQIFSTRQLYSGAFAALKSDGSVVTWGNGAGTDSSRVASQLSSGVTRIASTETAFAALKSNGSVVTWGEPWDGGDSSAVATQLNTGVKEVFSNLYSFAALKSDGSVISWGRAVGISTELTAQLSSGVKEIFSTFEAFAALKTDGSVVTWGNGPSGGDSSGVAGQLSSNVVQIVSSAFAFAALKSDGSVVTWGLPSYGGDSLAVSNQLKFGVTEVFSTGSAFAALKRDGSVVTWGGMGGDSSSVASQLSASVTKIFATTYPPNGAFAALKSDGSVVTWGGSGGDSSAVASQLSSGVTQIFSNDFAFAALKADGSVVTWGSPTYGGDSSAVASQLNNVVAFADPSTDDRLVVFDPPPAEISIVASPPWIPEDGDAKLIFSFTRTGDINKPLTVNYTATGTASLGIDYSGIEASGTTKSLAFAAGSSVARITVEPIDDNELEADETVILSLLAGPGYFFGSADTTVGTILNDDPYGHLEEPISIPSNKLGNTNLGYVLISGNDDPIQVTYPYGYASASNPGNGWRAVVSAPTASGYAVYWRTTSNGPTARWDLDHHGVYTSGFLLSALQLNREEAALDLDLNGDGFIAGPHSSAGVNLGSTSVGYALRNGSGAPLQVTYSGINASANNPGSGWTASAATTSGAGYALFWRNSNTGETVRWQLNSSGAYSSGSVLTPSQLISEEANLNLDLNGDGIVAVSLGSSPEGHVVLRAAPTPIAVTDSSGNAISSSRGDGWNALAVATSGSGFALYWGSPASPQIERWTLNASGVYESAVILTPSELRSAEAQFNLDLNRDGFVSGATSIDDVNLGSTSEGYALRHGDAGPLPVRWPEGQASASRPGQGWTAMAAKPEDEGYTLYWSNTISGQGARWQLDQSGSYQSGTFLSPSQLIAEEGSLNADLNGDHIIGRAAVVIETNGRASLSCNRDGLAMVGAANRFYSVRSPFDLGVGSSDTEWQMLAAEADLEFVSRYASAPTNCQILWRNNLGNFLHLWTLDNSWNWQSSSGQINPLSPDVLGLESKFQLDLDGNGLIG